VILEQDPNNFRSSHQAGIAYGYAVEEILHRYDATGLQPCTPSVATRIAYHRRQHFMQLGIIRHLTSWGLLYRILRANFDGMMSDAVPNPPLPMPGDGEGAYLVGRRVTSLEPEHGMVKVGFITSDGEEGFLYADLVIGADGVHSTIRNLVHAQVTKEYSGYVAWRGTICECELVPATALYFADRTSLNFLSDTYVVS
jgi:hypothetical protein